MGNRTWFAAGSALPGTRRRLPLAFAAIALAASVVTALPTPAAAGTPATLQPGPIPASPQQPTDRPMLSNGYGPSAGQNQAMTTAAQAAHASGKSVAVPALTTETQQVTAKPGGGFTLSLSANPVRTRQHGTWVPVDTTLHATGNGRLAPAATAYGTVSFSDGGSGPLVTTTSGGLSYSVSWPHTLPTPRVSGSTATYAEVLPGVDLDMSATVDGGFSDVLVVKTEAAAQNPDLTTLTLPAAAVGGTLGTSRQGTLELRDRHDPYTLDTATPLMWDSNTTPTGTSGKPHGTASKDLPDPSDAAHPGAAAHTSTVRAHTDATSLTLVPDTHLLTDPSTVLPVYIDPSFQWHPTAAGSPRVR